jgi:hypothetical protein
VAHECVFTIESEGVIKRVASAVGEGATVVRLVHEHLREAEPVRVAD